MLDGPKASLVAENYTKLTTKTDRRPRSRLSPPPLPSLYYNGGLE